MIFTLSTHELIAELCRRTRSKEQSTTADIVFAVAAITGVPGEVILGPSRVVPVCRARWIVIHQLRKRNAGWSLMKTGDQMNRHYGTILHAIEKYEQLYREDESFRLLADRCNNMRLTQ